MVAGISIEGSERDYHRIVFKILDVFHCPHHPEGAVQPYVGECDCRKPSAGMFQMANEKYNIEKAHSIMVGDKVSDVEAAVNFGLDPTNCFLVETGHALNDVKGFTVCANLVGVSTNITSKGRTP